MEILALLPELLVADPRGTARWYRDVLGFDIGHLSDEFAIVDRGPGKGFHFKRGAPRSNRAAVADAWDVYVEVRGIAALSEELRGKGVRVLRGPVETDYAMIELEIEDCDGHILCFAES